MITTLSRATVLSAPLACGWVPYWSARSHVVTPWSTPARRRSTTPSNPRPRIWFEDFPTPFVPVPWKRRVTWMPVFPRVTTSCAVFSFAAA